MAATPRPLWFRLARGALVAVAALALLLCLAAWWLLGTGSGARWLLGTALPYAQQRMPEDLRLDIEGIDADTLASIRIARLSLSDREGMWLEAERLVLDWTPSALWHGVFEAEEISAGRIHFIRPPISGAEAERSLQERVDAIVSMLESLPDTLQSLSLPPLRIHRLRADELALDSGLVDMPSRYALSGRMDLTARPILLALDLHSVKGIETKASATVSNAILAIGWEEEAGGMLGNMLQLATPAPMMLTVDSALHGDRLAMHITMQAGDNPLAEADIHLPLKGDARLEWEASLPQPALLAPLSGFPVAIDASGYWQEDAVHLLIRSKRIASSEGDSPEHAIAEATLRLDEGSPPFALDASIRADIPQDASAPLPLTLVLRAEGDAETWDVTMLNASAGAKMTATANGHLQLADGAAELEGTLSLPQLDARYRAHADNLWDSPQAEAELRVEALKQPLPAPLDTVITLPMTLHAETAGNDTAIPDVTFTLESRNINGSGAFYPLAAGNDPLAIAKIAVEGLPLPLTLSARHMPAGNGQMELRSESILLATDYALAEDRLELTDILLDAGEELYLAGNAAIHTATGLATGKLEGRLQSTAPLNRLGLNLPDISARDGNIGITATTPRNIQQVQAVFDSHAIEMEGKPLIGHAQLEAGMKLPSGTAPELSGTLHVQNVAQPLAVEKGTISVKGTPGRLALALHAQDSASKTDVTVTDFIIEIGDVIRLTPKGVMKASWKDNRLQLTEGFIATYGPDGISLHGLQLILNTPSQTINADFNLKRDKAEGRFDISKLPLNALPFGAFGGMKGVLDGKLTLSGSPMSPHATLVMDIEGLQHNYPNMTRIHNQPLTVTLRAELARQALSAHLSANAPDEQSFAAASLNLPVEVSLAPDNLHASTKGPIDAGLRADLILGPFLPLFMPDGVYGTGHLIADFSVRGQLDKPSVNGTMNLHSGRIEVLPTGTTIDAISLKAKASGNRITLSDGSATDGRNGRLTFGGTLRITPTMPMDIAAQVHEFVVMRHTNATATLSGETSLEGDLTDALLKGDWHVNEARITILNTGNGDVPEIRVVEVTSLDAPLELPEAAEMPEEKRKAAQEKRRKARPFARNLAMKIGITANNQIFLDGFGLTAELKGKVDISGTAARPKLGGQMETVRGRWEFFGKTFTITRGRAILSEDNLTAPLIDIRAETEAADILAIARITGTTDNPTIEFSSIPALPKDEILARVMFGANLNSISPYQALQLADMLRSLSGEGGSINPLSKLQNALGIDELKINNDTGNSEDVTVGVGKYLKENIYLEVEGGSGEESGKVSVEVDLTPRISVETETRQNAESAVRLNYKYDY